MIYTFYSFKGGVGRSMALANVAECFRQAGLRVALVDWDLEAPGLEHYFYEDRAAIERVCSGLGLIDLLLTYQRQFPHIAIALAEGEMAERRPEPVQAMALAGDVAPAVLRPEEAAPSNLPPTGAESRARLRKLLDMHLPPISTFLQPISPPATSTDGATAGSLSLMTAGWRAGDRLRGYAEAVQSFDWAEFYADFEGEVFFDWMREQLLNSADLVFVDSRTGVTEMGGVCTRQLADVVVSFCSPNAKTLENVLQVVDSFRRPEVLERRNQRFVEAFVVPTRLEVSEKDLRNEFEKTFIQQTERFVPAPFQSVGAQLWKLQIPYIPAYTYRESLAIGVPNRDEYLEAAYKLLAAHLALLSPEGSLVRRTFSSELQRLFPNALPRIYLAYQRLESGAVAEELRSRLRAAHLSVWEETSLQSEVQLDEQLRTQIEQSHYVVLVLSRGRPFSPWLREIYDHARAKGVQVLPVSADDHDSVPGEPRSLQATLHFRIERDLDKLIRTLAQPPPRLLRVPFMAPPLPESWVPRPTESARLVQALREPGARVALCGAPGSGKSCLAIDFCRSEAAGEHFDDGILWAELSPRPTKDTGTAAEEKAATAPAVLEELSRFRTALTGEQVSFSNTDEAVQELAARVRGKRILVVLDDVWDTAYAEPFLRLAGDGAWLLTTRNRGVVADSRATLIDVGPLTNDESQALLGSALPQDGPHLEAVAHLASELGNSPLILTLAAAELRRAKIAEGSVEKAVESVRESFRKGVTAFDERESTERQRSVRVSLKLSLQGLSRETYAALEALAQKYPANTDIRRENAGLGRGDFERLAAESLIEVNPAEASFRLHPLVHGYLRAVAPVAASKSTTGLERETPQMREAETILRGKAGAPRELLKLAVALKQQNQFGLARRLLGRARKDVTAHDDGELWRKLTQQHAICTYKDPDQLLDLRLDTALKILKEADDLAKTQVPETLGIAGAIHKRKWEVDGQRAHLERALSYYLRGAIGGVAADFGYTAINAAFILDCLAGQEEEAARLASAAIPESALQRRAQAQRIRQDILEKLPPLAKELGNEWLNTEWWFLVTVAEAAFGLRKYDTAGDWLARAVRIEVADWEYESTARQLAALARLHEPEANLESEPWSLIRRFLGSEAAVETHFTGRIGLALSGGGFRASLFHIGVLARLAELDVLRSVEVLSCVSGGSIIGAHYYLEVRKLLQEKADDDITAQDYIDIVGRLETDFLLGVQRNIRTRVVGSLLSNLKMIFAPHYSRTLRAGELFEREIFSRVEDGGGKAPRILSELRIQPKDSVPGFQPKYHNWRRRAKVPVLILNATTLNTGHNWQFTTSFMGEPPDAIDSEVDSNNRLRRMYYEAAPAPYRRFRLGHAVAASACVPGIFEPLVLPDLYPELTVRLVDGGVHDNQGIAGLLEQGMNVFLVSDASGQMELQRQPASSLLGVPLRANSILMARVREAEFRELRARRRSLLLRGLMFLHLKKDLETEALDWIGCTQPYDASEDARPPEQRGQLTSYGVSKEVQQKLAALRTDLDSFSDAEAYALMASAYRMTAHEYSAGIRHFQRKPAEAGTTWKFLEIEKFTSRTPGRESGEQALMKILHVGSQLALKVWRLSPKLQALGLLLCAAAAVLLIILAFRFSETSLLTVGALSATLFAFAVAAVFGKIGMRAVNFRDEVKRIAKGVAFSLGGWLVAGVHLMIFDPLYLSYGRLSALDHQKRGGWGRRIGILIIALVVALVLFAVYLRSALQGELNARASQKKLRESATGPSNAAGNAGYQDVVPSPPQKSGSDFRPSNSRLPPRIYFKTGSAAGVSEIEKLLEVLKDKGFAGELPKNVSGGLLGYSEVKYYFPEDLGEAQRLVKLLQSLGVENLRAEPRQVLGPSDARPRHYDVWIEPPRVNKD
jgi:predicted acylesterase/phospholipase RssA/MinD-like ATPase involved in chromosome partitioning or flagellar assembly